MQFPDVSALGSSDFASDIQSILSTLVSTQTGDDYHNAIGAFQELLSNFKNRGIFDTATIKSVMDATKGLLILGIDILQDFLAVLGRAIKFAMKQMLSLFDLPITIPPIATIYEALMGETCTLGRICALILALPFTITYKVITGEAPFKPSAGSLLTGPSGNITDGFDEKAYYTCKGIFATLETIFSTVQEAVAEFGVGSSSIA